MLLSALSALYLKFAVSHSTRLKPDRLAFDYDYKYILSGMFTLKIKSYKTLKDDIFVSEIKNRFLMNFL